ncbi:MAG: dihydroorotate dehydrogenase electron transfer subunit [Candidatus Omnitrophica bacterium]|nr:dihydroorotate dehydrogenase electron transfer subunit [Candidatus Omnitrophota bacterium]MCM8799127.1 dihydroorotate dehydrogenase electron transfer subunit [Candidatus Omnitrophota bacterium]
MSEINSKFQIPNSRVVENKKIKNKYFKMVIFCPPIAKYALPGQFVSIKIVDNYQPLLRRPFSIHRVQGKNIEILYEVIGKGTEILSRRKTDESIDVIGPLGNGFFYQEIISKFQIPILVSGGIGVAPFVFLAEELFQNSKFKIQNKPLVLLGAKTKNELLCEKDFKRLGCKVEVSTDDGSYGFKGKVTDLLKYLLSTINSQISTIYACGPGPMLKEVIDISKSYSIPTEVSLEGHMACGIGVCLGCVVNTKTGYKRVCKDGPVFKAEELVW